MVTFVVFYIDVDHNLHVRTDAVVALAAKGASTRIYLQGTGTFIDVKHPINVVIDKLGWKQQESNSRRG